MCDPLHLEVYENDADAFAAGAELAAQVLRAAEGDHPTVALSGGRGGRGLMLALAAREDAPWERIDWFWADERCVPTTDPRSNVRLARESLLGPRGIAAARIHPPPNDLVDPGAMAGAYAATLAAAAPIFDLVLLGLGPDGHIASLMPGCRALRETALAAPVAVDEVHVEPRVARITITPPVLRAARRVLLLATGAEKAPAVAAALRGDEDIDRMPAQLVRPSPTITWIVDRAAAGALLRDARSAP